MKLNDSYMAVWYETDPHQMLKIFYKNSHLSNESKEKGLVQEMMSFLSDPIKHKERYNGVSWWDERVRITNSLVNTTKNHKFYFITKKVLDEADMIKFDKIDLKWFSKLDNQESTYIVGKDDFYRFVVEKGKRINILHYRIDDTTQGKAYWYDSYSIILTDGELATMPTQKQEFAIRFVKLLLYIELGEITYNVVKAKTGKIKFGTKGDDKLKNETSLDVILVNSSWNKVTIVVGGFSVRGHLRVQPCGVGRKDYKLTWVKEHTKGSFVRKAGKVDN
jgi:hypothetical protein